MPKLPTNGARRASSCAVVYAPSVEQKATKIYIHGANRKKQPQIITDGTYGFPHRPNYFRQAVRRKRRRRRVRRFGHKNGAAEHYGSAPWEAALVNTSSTGKKTFTHLSRRKICLCEEGPLRWKYCRGLFLFALKIPSIAI